MSLRMWEILLIAIGLETASHLILRLIRVKTVLNVSTLVGVTVGVIDFLNATRRRSEGMRIYLRIVATDVVGSLDHIKPSIGRAKFFHFIE